MADTTRINMGRRKMPRCADAFCSRRVDTPADDRCRVCSGRERPPARKPRRHIVRKGA